MSSYERLTVEDRIFLEMETPSHHMHVAGVFLFEAAPLQRPGGGIDIERIGAYVESRLHLVPRYRQRLARLPVEGHPIWVDDESFNLLYHVRHTALPAPGDERQLKRLCGRIVSQQLDRGKPLWEMWVVEGLEGDRIAVITKAHHCMIDGIAGVDLIRSLLTPTPVKSFEPPPAWLPRPLPGRDRLLRDSAWYRLRAPLELGGALWRGARDPGAALGEARDLLGGLRETRALESPPASETPLNRRIGPHRRFDWLAFDLDAVKAVKRKLGGTVNDVALATLAGALGRFLEQRGVTPREQQDLDVRAAVPVNTRGERDRGRFGNRVAFLAAPLPIAEPDARKRLREVSRGMRKLKGSKQVEAFEALCTLGEWTSPAVLTAFARRNLARRTTNLVVTNVPGPAERLYLLDAPMLETYPVVPVMPDQALGVALFSYASGLFWGFNADWDLMPDLHDLVLAVDQSFRELCDAAGS